MARTSDVTDAMATELDCNDNSPRLRRFHQDGITALTGPAATHAMPHHTELTTSETVGDKRSDIKTRQRPGITFSPEDTLNNDFFFDDEFTIPFDAHLSENPEEMCHEGGNMDSTEMANLLVASSDEVLFRKREFRMTSSKSDSCLYNGDNEFSEGELCDPNEMSQELTPSERGMHSSGSMSDLNNGPLFSPQSSFTVGAGNNANHSEMTNSFLNGSEPKYNFDWRANKDQYTISFDKQALKGSSVESSLSGSLGQNAASTDKLEQPRRLTTWAIQRESSVSQGSWASNSTESHSSRKSDTEKSKSNSKRPASFHERSKSEENRTMTSWKAIKTPSPGQSEDELGKSAERDGVHSRSQGYSYCDNSHHYANIMSSQELKDNQMRHLHFDISPPSLPHPESVSSEYHTCSEGREGENPRRRSSPLLELYIRSKTQSDDCETSTERILEKLRSPEQFCNEAMVSPNVLRRLTGTWSMSTASSRSSRHESPLQSPQHRCTKDLASLRHWDTIKNLSHETKLGNSFNGSITQDVYGCQCDLSACMDCSAQIGGAVLNMNQDSVEKLEQSAQFPPSVNTVSIQTSFHCPKSKAPSDRYSLIDIGVQTRGRAASEPFSARSERLGNLPISKVSPVIARNRLAKTILQKKSGLPDLSFLKSNLSTSSVIRATTSSTNLNKSSKSCQTDTEVPPPIPPRVRRSVSASPTASRESSPANYSRKTTRSNSVSVCSSSSSGIDPGRSSCESQLNRLSVWSGGDMHFGSSDYFVGTHSREWAKHIAVNADRVCVACHARFIDIHHVQNGVKTIESVNSSQDKMLLKNPKCSPSHVNHENSKESPTSDEDLQKVSLDTVKSSSTCKESHESINTGSKGESRDWICDEPVKMRRPLKSCLRRKPGAKNERAMKHRSWSDPYDATILRYSQDGETRYQLITNIQGKTCWAKLDTSSDVQQTSLPSQASDDFLDKEFERECDERVKHHCGRITSEGNEDRKQDGAEEEGDSLSPDKIPMMQCACGTTHAVLYSSSDSGGTCSAHDAASRAKKTVSFAEKVSYHSPAVSPHPSPKKTKSCGQLCEEARGRVHGGTYPEMQYRNLITRDMLHAIQNACAEDVQRLSTQIQIGVPPPKPPRMSRTESPPKEFIVSTSSSVSTASPSTSTIIEVEQQLLVQKHALVVGVIKASEIIQHYFDRAQDEIHRETLASSKEYPEIGHVVLEHLCPALVAVMDDGLRPHVRSVFGKVKNNPWRMMEDSVNQGTPARVLGNLVKDLNALDFLNTPALKFNALIFGLLNHRVLDFWLTYMSNHEGSVVNNYVATAFLSLSQSTARQLFLDMTMALQPLAKIPFKLEYNLEYKLVKAREDEELSDLLLHKHTSSSVDARLERILNQNHINKRPLSVDQALDLLSNSDDSVTSFSSSPSIKDSVQLKIDSLKQYSNAMHDTKEKTKTLLKVTGDSIKEKFKQIQRQNRDGEGSITGSTDLTKYLPSSDALFGTSRSRGRKPMRVPHLRGVNDNIESTDSETSSTKSNSRSKDDSYLKGLSNLILSKGRSQSLDSIPIVRNGEVTLGDSTFSDKPASRTSSLTDLVSFIGKKIVDYTVGGKDETAYKEGVTNYTFENGQSGLDEESNVDDAMALSTSFEGELDVELNPLIYGESASRFKDTALQIHDDIEQSKEKVDTKSMAPSDTSNTERHEAEVKETNPEAPQQVKNTVCASPKMHRKLQPIAAQSPVNIDFKQEASPIREPINKSQKPAESLSNTARMFTRRFGLSLISAFDKLLVDPKKKQVPPPLPTKQEVDMTSPLPRPRSANEKLGQEDMLCSAAVKKSASAMEFPKRQVETLCGHKASETEELSFEKESVLTVVKEVDKDWLLCYNENGRGLVRRGLVKQFDGQATRS